MAALALNIAEAVRSLPEGPLLMGYAPGCDQDKIINAVQSGVNVLFWFSIALVNDGGVPAITGGPDLDCIASSAATLTSLGLETTHMVSVGGWDAPHPTTDFPAEEMYAAFKDWNEKIVARAGIPNGFDGIDWDLEGNDTPSDPNN